MSILLRISALFLLVAATSSCSKDKANELEGDWLFPIAKGNLSINSLDQLKNLKYEIAVPPFSIGQPINIPVNSPALHIAHVGPFPVQITDWLHRVDIDTLEFTGSLNNFFPIPIGAGTTVTLRNSRDTSAASIVGSAIIDHNVAPGDAFSFDILVYNKTLGDSAFFYLDQFNSPAFNNVTFTNNPARLVINLDVITASFVQIYTNKAFTSIDTSEFSAGSDDNSINNISDTSAQGFINVFTENGLPANIRSQLYFLNEAKTHVLDSMFASDLVINGGQTDGAGNTTFTNKTTTRVAVNQKKLNNLKQAKYVVSRFDFNTTGYSGPYVSANKGPSLAIQFTGDLNIRINF
jgi:hypothetical protein